LDRESNFVPDAVRVYRTEIDRARTANTSLARPGFLVFAIALVVRLIALPFATLQSADQASRVWSGWDWLDHPHLITEGVWGPLHIYLIGSVLWLWPDPVWAPLILHVVLGAVVPVVVYQLALELFGSQRGALLAGLAFAVYPTGMLVSLAPLSETPFILFLGIALLLVARARRPDRRLRDATLAGVSIGLATMLRYEAWMLLPFLTLLLLDRPKQCLAFLIPGLIHPIVWMLGNANAHGDPLYSIHWASHYHQFVHGGAQLVGLVWGAKRIWLLAEETIRGLTPPLSLLIGLGVLAYFRRWRSKSIWLLPPLGLALLLAVAAVQGSLSINLRYTVTFGLMLVPFAACSLDALGIETWSRRRFVAAAVALLVAVGVFTIQPLWKVVPGGARLFSPAIPRPIDEGSTREVLALVDRSLVGHHDALVSDFFDWEATYWVALETKLHPKHICLAPPSPDLPLNLVALEGFLQRNPHGVLVSRDGSELAEALNAQLDNTVIVGTVHMSVKQIGAVRRQAISKWKGQAGDLHVARYEVLRDSTFRTDAISECWVSSGVALPQS